MISCDTTTTQQVQRQPLHRSRPTGCALTLLCRRAETTMPTYKLPQIKAYTPPCRSQWTEIRRPQRLSAEPASNTHRARGVSREVRRVLSQERFDPSSSSYPIDLQNTWATWSQDKDSPLRLLHHTALASLFATFGRVICEALCVGSSHHYWSGREGVVVGVRITTPSRPDHYCSSYKAVLLHTAPPPCGGELQLLLWRLLHHTALASLFATFGLAHLQE